jgi:integration host factor subunit beta
MNRSTLVAKLAQRHGLSNRKAEELTSLMLQEMGAALAQGDRIEFRGFGSFFVKSYDARTAKNPKSGDFLWIKDRKKVRFRASGLLLSKINDALL